MHSFDALVIGAGQAGPPLAMKLGERGERVALIERSRLGGTCVNTGCIPTKTMVASAYAAHMARRAQDFGVHCGSTVTVDLARVLARKDEVSGNSRKSLATWLSSQSNVTLKYGHAKFLDANSIEVDGERITATRIFINVGTRPYIPTFSGIDATPYLTNASLMQLDSLPEHLIIIGGSYIGLEFGQMFRRFGSKVTIVEKDSRLISREDTDISLEVERILEAEDIRLRLNAECISAGRRGNGVVVGAACREGEPQIEGSHLLIAVGRKPNTDDLNLQAAGIEIDGRGYIKVDDQLRTSAENVWALGDCNGHGAFTHTSYNDFEIVASNLLDGEARRVTDRITTYALFIDPPLARVGMTEAQARATGRKILIGTRPMTRVGRAVERGETLGFMKMLVDAQTQVVLGASILGASGDEAIHSLIDAMYARAAYTTVTHAVHIHPTVAELIPTVLGNLTPLGDAVGAGR